MATKKKVKKVKKAASSKKAKDYRQIDMYIAVVVSIILAIIVISYVGWKTKKNSDTEISTRGYAKVTKFYKHFPSMRGDIRAALKDKKITYKELKVLKDKYRETAKRSLR